MNIHTKHAKAGKRSFVFIRKTTVFSELGCEVISSVGNKRLTRRPHLDSHMYMYLFSRRPLRSASSSRKNLDPARRSANSSSSPSIYPPSVLAIIRYDGHRGGRTCTCIYLLYLCVSVPQHMPHCPISTYRFRIFTIQFCF